MCARPSVNTVHESQKVVFGGLSRGTTSSRRSVQREPADWPIAGPVATPQPTTRPAPRTGQALRRGRRGTVRMHGDIGNLLLITTAKTTARTDHQRVLETPIRPKSAGMTKVR